MAQEADETGSERSQYETKTYFSIEEYECTICYNYFDLGGRTPKLLDCLHTFCEECLNNVYVREDRRWRIGCPLCRHRTPVPEYQIQNLPNNTKVTDSLPLHIKEVDSLPQDILPSIGPSLHPTITTAYCQLEERHSRPAAQDYAVSTVPTNRSDKAGNENWQNCKRIAFTTSCVCAIICFLSMVVLLFLGLIFVHNFNNPPSSVGPICLSVASILAIFSVITTWLMCWLKHRFESETTERDSVSSRHNVF